MSITSFEDIKSAKLLQQFVAEFFGTFFLVVVACGSGSLGHPFLISFSFGLTVSSAVWVISHVSGGHINPAVTISFFVTRKISFLRSITYIIAQCVGGMVGACLLWYFKTERSLAQVKINVSLTQGFFIELLITFILVWTVFASCDANRPSMNSSAPVSIGISIIACHFWAVPLTGAGMNPARSLASNLVTMQLNSHFVLIYWVGPILGGVFSAILYDFFFAANASMEKISSFFSLDYDEEYFDEKGKKIIKADLTSIHLSQNI